MIILYEESPAPTSTPTSTPTVVITQTEEQQKEAAAQASAAADYQTTVTSDLNTLIEKQAAIEKKYDDQIKTFNSWSADILFILQVFVYLYIFEWCWSHMREWRRQLTRKDK